MGCGGSWRVIDGWLLRVAEGVEGCGGLRRFQSSPAHQWPVARGEGATLVGPWILLRGYPVSREATGPSSMSGQGERNPRIAPAEPRELWFDRRQPHTSGRDWQRGRL
jgi:hypothetical protein